MPVFIGEWGHSRLLFNPNAGGWVGWSDATALVCDRMAALDAIGSVGASSAWWHFDQSVGIGFGLYDPVQHRWIDAPDINGNGDQGIARPFAPGSNACS